MTFGRVFGRLHGQMTFGRVLGRLHGQMTFGRGFRRLHGQMTFGCVLGRLHGQMTFGRVLGRFHGQMTFGRVERHVKSLGGMSSNSDIFTIIAIMHSDLNKILFITTHKAEFITFELNR